ncbi:AAA+ family ATPase [Oceaniglobus ichthyenteri]|uniref:AAA+ family ATPase n=1 Tax=Oceaniglobus ichthyenteri TaxID=2136177 RepID=UPI001F0C3940|nr:AAA+ family ATPase [Oceaniglobus ichthyenteri]
MRPIIFRSRSIYRTALKIGGMMRYMNNMKQIAMLLLAASLAGPVAAQSSENSVEEGAEKLNEGARELFRGLLDEIEPAMRDFARQLQELNWKGLTIKDLDEYEPPEVLPNGDIILRRKTPKLPDSEAPEPDEPLIDLPQIDL